MKKQRLKFYTLDMKYVRNLSKVDDNVFSVSPQQGKENRPFVGVVVIVIIKNFVFLLLRQNPNTKT